jgi:hypothetical protein
MCPDDGGSKHHCNIDNPLQDYTAQYPRRRSKGTIIVLYILISKFLDSRQEDKLYELQGSTHSLNLFCSWLNILQNKKQHIIE